MADDEHAEHLQTVTNTFLLEGLRSSGNKTVWQQFVGRYQPLLVKFAKRQGLPEADAQDAAQQTLVNFCTAYQQGKYDREQGRLRHWLFGIARNTSRNWYRRQRKQEMQITDDTSQTGFFARQPDEGESEKIWEEEWRDAVLRQCLEEIRREVDPKSVEAFELFAWKGWPAQKVAEHLDMTPNAVFIVKHRIMKRIRDLLPKMEEAW